MSLRILVAEDNPINQRVTLLLLARSGATIDLVTDGEAAVAACRTQSYDVILMDVHMPVMDGIEATIAIREMPSAQPKIIALTAMAMTGDREKCLGAGMDDYLSKPFKAHQLAEAIDSVVNLESPRSSISSAPNTHKNQRPPVTIPGRAFCRRMHIFPARRLHARSRPGIV